MSLSSKHPQYADGVVDWQTMSDAYDGERRIKDKGQEYLPATPGQLIDGLKDGEKGLENYKAYKSRARFPDLVAQAVEALIGIMHSKPPTIELPPQLEALRESATVKGESLEMLLRRINEHQLITGRLGIMADVANDAPAGVLPYVAIYRAQDIINWDDGARGELVFQNLNMVVLNESEYERVNEFDWEQKTKYRLLLLGDIGENQAAGTAVYSMGLFDETKGEEFTPENMFIPSIAGTTLSELPFVIINSKDIVPDPDDPPLLGLAQLAITIYRADADYRQAIFMQGQDTLVVIGGIDDDKDLRAGAGAHISVIQGGNAKYIGVSSTGLPEMRKSLENDKAEAAEIGGKLLDTTGREAESGDALRIRVSARTASLNQIAMAGAEGLKALLQRMAVWVGADPGAVDVIPNTDFADDTLDGQTLTQYMSAKALGAPWSKRSIHELLQEKDLTKLTFEEEMTEIEQEGGDEGDDGTSAGGDLEDE